MTGKTIIGLSSSVVGLILLIVGIANFLESLLCSSFGSQCKDNYAVLTVFAGVLFVSFGITMVFSAIFSRVPSGPPGEINKNQ